MASQAERDALLLDAINAEPMPDKAPATAERADLPRRLGVEDSHQLAALLGLAESTVSNYLAGRDPGIFGTVLHRATALAEKVAPRS